MEGGAVPQKMGAGFLKEDARTLGLLSAISKAIWPMRREARSVIKRVARASLPAGVVVCVSSLIY